MAHSYNQWNPMGLTGIFYNRALEYIDASFAIILLLQFTWISMILQFIVDKQTPSRKSVDCNGYHFTWLHYLLLAF